jgi:hypothetical protein
MNAFDLLVCALAFAVWFVLVINALLWVGDRFAVERPPMDATDEENEEWLFSDAPTIVDFEDTEGVLLAPDKELDLVHPRKPGTRPTKVVDDPVEITKGVIHIARDAA